MDPTETPEERAEDNPPYYDPEFGKSNPGGVLEEFTQRTMGNVVTVNKLPEDELRRFTLALCDGHVFTSAHLHENEQDLLPMVFMPLALGMFRDHTEREMAKIKEDLAILWEYTSAAGPRAINGLPMFMSVRLMHKDDWQRARTAYEAEMERRKNFTV